MNRLIAQHGDTTHGTLGINGDKYHALYRADGGASPGQRGWPQALRELQISLTSGFPGTRIA